MDWNRVIQSVFAALITAALLWTAGAIQRLDTKVSVMQAQLTEGIADRYRGADAKRDFALRDERISHNRAEIDRLKAFHSMRSATE